ncbi:hypothetical protein ACN28S_21435 [Cystobacter fuscus]
MGGIALSLGLEEEYFATGAMADPLVLFRIFNYPPGPAPPGTDSPPGASESTRIMACSPSSSRTRPVASR